MNNASTKLCRRIAAAVTLGLISMSPYSYAYESDVHYGLTKWLALKAGFANHEAEAIAQGNQRVDSGGPQAIDTVLDYGCALLDSTAAKRVQQAHTPSQTTIPAPPAERHVIPGGDLVKKEMSRVLQEAKGKEALMLSLFGASLHIYQDSWSHAGIPSVIDVGNKLKCRSTHAASHPISRGGPGSHNADITYMYPEEAMRMARASYDALTSFPIIEGKKRSPTSWENMTADVKVLVDSRTKTQKKAWFIAQGVSNVDFLAGTTLPDGAEVHPVRSKPNLLPVLNTNKSNQFDVSEDIRAFFDQFLASWLLNTDVDKLVTNSPAAAGTSKDKQLRAKLKLLKMRDHGTTAGLIHKQGALSVSDLRKVTSMTRDSSVYARPESLADAMLPLMTKETPASPLLPYIVRKIPSADKKLQKVIAIMRLTHLPYDSVGLVAELTASGWGLVDIVVAVDQ